MSVKSWKLYHDDSSMPGRWRWADAIPNTRVHHRGWWIDEDQFEKIRGIVITLNHARGWLAGWSMGEGMCAEIDNYVYLDELWAAQVADSMAENAALHARELQEEHLTWDDDF